MKILTFSFDDCEIYDRQLCDMMRQYGIKGTFFLMSGRLGEKVPFHRYGEDTVVERVVASELPDTYRGMEIASHTRHHTMGTDLEETVGKSLQELEAACGYTVQGLAYPGGGYRLEQVEQLRQMPVAYARTISRGNPSFDTPVDWLTWTPTCHYADECVPELVQTFLNAPADADMLFHLYGHSYELTRKDGVGDWAYMEHLLQQLANRTDVMYATNLEAYRLLCKTNASPESIV